jgi:lysophospholipase L1-like esterase
MRQATRHLFLVCSLLAVPALTEASGWVATWAASPQAVKSGGNRPLLQIDDQTVRERVRVSVGGDRICVRLSNEYGATPLLVGSVTVATPADAASIKPASLQTVRFGGLSSVSIPPGAPVLSDPVAFPTAAGEEISISLYFPKRVATPTLHWFALKRAVISARGDHTREEKIEGGAASRSWILVSAVLVPAQSNQRMVVAFGDSITDGDGSTPEADRNWPNDLIRRLAKTAQASQVAVVNEGVIGNRLLADCFDEKVTCFSASGLARFDRDALALPGVTHVVLEEGINDIGFPGAQIEGDLLADPADVRRPEDLIGAYRQFIARAHARGIKVIGVTMTPFEGVVVPGYYSEAKETARQAVNKWIRTSGSFDGVIDFDAVLRDPEHPSRLLPRFAAEDHLHPNDAGYQAVVDAIDLTLLK